MLTIQELKDMKPHTIFDRGEIRDSQEGCNVADTGRIMRWVAVRGGSHDWYIAVQNPHYINSEGVWDWEMIKDMGDKIHDEDCIKKLIECDDEAFTSYNH